MISKPPKIEKRLYGSERSAKNLKAVTAVLNITYNEGVAAYRKGILLTDNPYGRLEPMLMCAWSGGWWDEHRGLTAEKKEKHHQYKLEMKSWV